MEGAFTSDFLFSIERRMRNINERNYMKLLASGNLWAPKVLKNMPLEGKSERVTWLLDTASIEQLTPNDGGENGGSINFDELATITTEYFPAYHARGFRIGKMRWLNFLQGGIDPVSRWAGAVGTYGAYYPQRLAAQLLLNGANITGYDGVSFWNTAHPNHPLIPALGSYANLFTGSASGVYPGACPIDDTVALDVALTNLSKILGYIEGSILQPNGAGDPRLLVARYILHPKRMTARVNMICNAAEIPIASTGGAGSADVRAHFQRYGTIEPIEAKELGAATSYTIPGPLGVPVTVTGSDTTFYIVCEEASDTELGALLLNMRMPFTLHTYTGDTGGGGNALLGRQQKAEYHYDGWIGANVGHPYAIFQCKAS
jgi:hypothetical protein